MELQLVTGGGNSGNYGMFEVRRAWTWLAGVRVGVTTQRGLQEWSILLW